MRTKEEIDKELALLREMKPKVPQLSAFGDDNHAAIQAQIEVLEEKLDDEGVNDRFEYDKTDILDDAMSALEWMSGEKNESPSSEWADLAKG